MAIPPHHVTTPQGGPQVYGDAEAESLREDLELTMGDAASSWRRQHGAGRPIPSRYQILTMIGLVALAVLTLAFNLDIGFVAITIGLVLSLIAPNLQKRAMGQVSWPEIVLITGVSTYVGVLQAMGTIDFVGHSVAGLTSPLMAALLLCFIGAVVSAFASSTAVLGSLIPLAVPFLQAGTGVERHRLHRGDGGVLNHRRCQPLLDQWRSGARQCPGRGPRGRSSAGCWATALSSRSRPPWWCG